MKISELPKGTVIELSNGERYEMSADWKNVPPSDSISRDALDDRDDVKIISLPYEVTLKLATWLDNVYTKTGDPESLIIEAVIDCRADKDTPYISDRPKKG